MLIMVKLLISPPATGKTHTCIELVQSTVKKYPLATVWVIVPDRLQVTAFHRRLAEAGGALGAHVGTFPGIYREILGCAWKSLPVASEPILYRLVQTVVDEFHERGKLIHYKEIREFPGFNMMLREGFAELERSFVLPEAVQKKSFNVGPGLIELGLLYEAYQNKLKALNWVDSERLGWLAVEALSKDPGLLGEWPLLVVDGFDEFNPTQRRVLKLLSERVSETLVTLPGSPDMEEPEVCRPAHRRFSKALQDLQNDLQCSVVAHHKGSCLPEPLVTLEKGLFEVATEQIDGQGVINLLEVSSMVIEVREALRWLKSLIIREQVPAWDCAVIIPSQDLYNPLLRAAAEEFGIVLRFNQSRILARAPAMVALLEMLNLPLKNYSRRLLLDTIRAPFFNLVDFGFQREHANLLEIISRDYMIIEGLSQWEEAFQELTSSDGDKKDHHLPYGDAALELKTTLRGFTDRLEPPVGMQIMYDWVYWLEALLEDLGFFKQVESQLEREALIALRRIFRSLVLSETIAGERYLDYAQFVTELQGLLEVTGYRKHLDPGIQAIQVLDMIEARGLRFQAVTILGQSEGLFPKKERSDPLLSEEVRTSLGMIHRLGRDQAGIFYQAITRSDKHLLITRPYIAEDGAPWEPSPYWNAVREIIAETPQRIRIDTPRSLVDAASENELLFWATRRECQTGESLPESYEAALQECWSWLRQEGEVLIARLSNRPRGPYEGYPNGLSSTLQRRYGSSYQWSASRLESYGTCPYWFYVGSVLGMEVNEIPKVGFDAACLGLMLHEILENTYRQAGDPCDLDELLVTMLRITTKVFEKAPKIYTFRPSVLWEAQQIELLAMLERNILELSKLGEDWVPFQFESAFGFDDKPLLELELDIGKVRLHGYIDRVDINNSGQLRVIDYKSGSSHLDRKALIRGRRLQLPLYALATRDALQYGDPVEGFYWKLFPCEASSLKLSRFTYGDLTGPEGAFEIARQHIRRIISGIWQASFPPLPPSGGCPPYCPASAWCWRYKPSSW